ncbi:MAG: hypothetical protein U1E14_11700 [Geminicoccaceae bacterium]
MASAGSTARRAASSAARRAWRSRAAASAAARRVERSVVAGLQRLAPAARGGRGGGRLAGGLAPAVEVEAGHGLPQAAGAPGQRGAVGGEALAVAVEGGGTVGAGAGGALEAAVLERGGAGGLGGGAGRGLGGLDRDGEPGDGAAPLLELGLGRGEAHGQGLALVAAGTGGGQAAELQAQLVAAGGQLAAGRGGGALLGLGRGGRGEQARQVGGGLGQGRARLPVGLGRLRHGRLAGRGVAVEGGQLVARGIEAAAGLVAGLPLARPVGGELVAAADEVGMRQPGALALRPAGGEALAGPGRLGLQHGEAGGGALEVAGEAGAVAAQGGKVGLGSLRLGSGGDGAGGGAVEPGHRLAPARQQPQRLGQAQLLADPAVALRLAGLLLQLDGALLELGQAVAEAGHVRLGRLQPQLGLAAAAVQPADAGGLLEQAAALLRLGVDDEADLALADDRGAAGAGAGVGEQQLDVARTGLAAVDAVERAGAAAEAAGDLQLVDAGGQGGDALGCPLHLELDLGDVEGGAAGGAAEDDVVHLVAAQAAGRGLAHHPAQRLDDVGLAAAVRPDDPGQPGVDRQLGRLAERLEAADAKSGYLQRASY